ncbi:mediator of DNA damage checkpoint protein 1-like isoform X2 [Asterias rubens]|uniref:mediator of DNA damage checkpoint protein 1-like isoform X2 n=1 Tax=Asterias rubens TaxID=7604 RepID=UPI001455BDC5|nr:mediator of DNA damage checkpoint protein 1-like isoform X2 [Asterias rubens]
MEFDGFDQTQAIALDDYSDDTDDLGDPENKQPVGQLKVFSQKSFQETLFPVFEGDNFIGRHESNQICIPLKALSKRHACIEIQGDSHLIYDMESRNKTRRGKLFLKPSVRYELHHDDSLIFGDVTCQFIQVEKKYEAESDDGSDTDSELMFQDLPKVGEKTSKGKDADFGSSSSYDILQPTQAYGTSETERKIENDHLNKEKKTILLETPQRDPATLIFAEASDENIPTEPDKSGADNSMCHRSIEETPGTKPLAESTVINDTFDEDERNEQSDLDISTLALAPTQAYGHFAELETQAYPTVTDSDAEEEEVRQSLFDAPTQAFTVPDSEEEDTPRRRKRISLEPTLLLNLSSDDDKNKPYQRSLSSDHHGIEEEATMAYDETTSESDEHPQGPNNEEAETLAFADLATQAFCPEDSDEAVDVPGSKSVPVLEPTLKYDMQSASLEDCKPKQAEAETVPDIPKTESDTDDDKREQGVEPTLKYDMGIEGSKEEERGDLATEPTLAYTTEEDDDEVMDVSTLAGAETQAYVTTDSDSDHDCPEMKNSRKPVHDQANTKPPVANIAEEPTLAYEGMDEAPKMSYSEEATLAYSNDDDEPMDTDMSLADGEARGTVGFAEMETQQADGVESEAAATADPNAPTLQYSAEDEDDDATMATQAYGADTSDGDKATVEKPSTSLAKQHSAVKEGETERGGEGLNKEEVELGDDDDDEANPETEGEKPSSSLAKEQSGVVENGIAGRQEGLNKEEIKPGENDADDDFTLATQVYGAIEESETQVPDSQEGIEEEEGPLVGLTHRVSSMLRKVPERSAMASPEKKQTQRVRRVAFMEQTQSDEEDSPQEETKATRKSARGRKPKVKEPQRTRFTETDAKPTRRKSKDLTLPSEASRKRKESRDVVEGEKKSVDGDSEESAVEVKEDQGPVWKSTSGLEMKEVNNNILDKPAARRTSRRQASYKKAVHDEDSDDTESMSSTSSLQVAVGEPSGRSLEALGITEVTVCDGKLSEEVVKPRRGRRSKASKEAASKEAASKEAASKASNVPKRKYSSSVITDPETDTPAVNRQAKVPKLKISLGRQESESDKIPKSKQSVDEDSNSSSKGTRSTRGRKAADVSQESNEVKETPVSARRGRKPKAAAKTLQESTKTPKGKGQKQSSITDYVVAEDTSRLTNTLSSDPSIEKVQKKQTKETKERCSLPATNSEPSCSRRARTSSAETVTKPSTKPSAEQETFLAPEPVKKGGRKRRGTKDEDQGSDASQSDASPLGTNKKEDGTQGKGGKRGRKAAVLETPKKEEQSLTTPNNRRGKRASTPTLSTSTGKKVSASETPEGEVASPSLRRRPSDLKPKVMFTGVIDKSWQKIVSSLGGELVESVFDCTHLVTDKVRRTVKFLCCLSRGALIVVPDWLDKCKVSKTFVDPAPYLVKDKAAEKQHGFTHVTSQQRALQGGVMTKYRVFVTGSVKPEPQQMKEIILCAGGKFLSSLPVKPDPYTIIISCEEDKAKCQSAIKAGLQIVSAEFILTGMLRQEIQPELYQLFTSTPSTSERGTKRKVSETPSSSKRKR